MRDLLLLVVALLLLPFTADAQTQSSPNLGTQTSPSGAGSMQSAASSSSANGEKNCAAYPDLQACLDDAGPGGSAFIPVGTYQYYQALQPYSGQRIRCASGAGANHGWIPNSVGAVLKPQGAIWALENLRTEVEGLALEHCTFDLVGNVHALGALNLTRISKSTFRENFVSMTDSGSVQTQYGIYCDALNWAGATCAYNDFFGNKLEVKNLKQPFANSHVGVYLTNQANENHFFGGYVNGFDRAVVIDNGNNNSFYALSVDGWGSRCYVMGPHALYNTVSGERCEGYTVKPGGAQFELASGSMENVIYTAPADPGKGATATIIDNSGAKNRLHGVYDLATQREVTMFTGAATHSVGINKTPEVGLALDVKGRIASDTSVTTPKLIVGGVQYNGGNTICWQAATAPAAGDGAEKVLYQCAVGGFPPGARGLRITFAWSHDSGNGSVSSLVKAGSTVIATQSSSVAGPGLIDVKWLNDPGMTSAQTSLGFASFGSAVGGQQLLTSAVDTTHAFTISAAFIAAKAERVTGKGFLVEWIY